MNGFAQNVTRGVYRAKDQSNSVSRANEQSINFGGALQSQTDCLVLICNTANGGKVRRGQKTKIDRIKWTPVLNPVVRLSDSHLPFTI